MLYGSCFCDSVVVAERVAIPLRDVDPKANERRFAVAVDRDVAVARMIIMMIGGAVVVVVGRVERRSRPAVVRMMMWWWNERQRLQRTVETPW